MIGAVIPKAEAAVRNALRLDDTLSHAHATLGSILTNFYWKWEEGESEFQRARELRRRSPDSLTAATGVESLIRAGRVEEAIAESERAIERDPRAFNARTGAPGTRGRIRADDAISAVQDRRVRAAIPGSDAIDRAAASLAN